MTREMERQRKLRVGAAGVSSALVGREVRKEGRSFLDITA